jgi:hypothetical protein
MYGSFSEIASEVWDFTRCQRANGTFYGTSGKCRSGSEVDAKEKPEAKPKAAKKKASPKKKVDEKLAKLKPEQLTKLAKDPRLTSEQKAKVEKAAGGSDESYGSLMRKQQELVQKGDIAGATKLNEKIKAAAEKAKNSPEAKAAEAKLKKEAAAKTDEQKEFDKAQDRRVAGQIAAKLTPKDKKVISDYTKETGGQSPRSYDNMNGCLRFPPSCPDPKVSKQFVKEFDAALNKLPKNESGDRFYRGVQVNPGRTEQLYKALQNAKPGMKMKDPGYGSYSAERKEAERFTSRTRPNIIFVTRSKSMTPISVYSEVRSENEAILPRGTEQTIRKVTKEGKNLIVELD